MVSQQTADLLIAAGKQHWLKPRKDKIQAKVRRVWEAYKRSVVATCFSTYFITVWHTTTGQGLVANLLGRSILHNCVVGVEWITSYSVVKRFRHGDESQQC